jgi:hypothetical protein
MIQNGAKGTVVFALKIARNYSLLEKRGVGNRLSAIYNG